MSMCILQPLSLSLSLSLSIYLSLSLSVSCICMFRGVTLLEISTNSILTGAAGLQPTTKQAATLLKVKS